MRQNKKLNQINFISEKGDKLKILAKLKNENENLNNEIKFLEEKNRRLKLKIDQMKKIIQHLEDQKAQLEIFRT